MNRLIIASFMSLATLLVVAHQGDNIMPSEGEPVAKTETMRKNRNCFKKGVQLLSTGYGIPGIGKSAFDDLDEIYPKATFTSLGPIFLKYEYAIGDKWGLGLVTRFATSKVVYPVNGPVYDDNQNPTGGDSTYTHTQSFRSFGLMARGNLHFGTSHSWDHYIGVGLGYGNSAYKVNLGGDLEGKAFEVSLPIPIAWEATVGTRYYFSDKVGAYAELGFSQSVLNAGFTYLIK